VLAFLPCVLIIWWSQRIGVHQRLAFLVVASYVFYGYWDYRFVSLLMLSTVIDYAAGSRIHQASSHGRKACWLAVSMVSNLGLLGYFKYAGFFSSSCNAILQWMHTGQQIPVPEILLPAGISFYTFQTMSYSIDVFRGKAAPAKSLLHFATYVALFPQLIAGPIVRYTDLEDQLRQVPSKLMWSQFAKGILFFVVGMCQKVVLADTIAAKVNPLLADVASLEFLTAWFCVFGYACQLYFDFSGYSNMAVGLGHLLGFAFPQNFDSPYKSSNISDFWRRWHMTLSSFLRDYLFIPLGGSRCGALLTVRNVVIVMFLGGLWHGAGWTFVLWGLVHGALLAIHAIHRHASIVRLPKTLAIGLTFVVVNLTWVLFRSADLNMAWSWYAALLGFHGIDFAEINILGRSATITLALLLAIVFLAPNVWQLRLRPTLWLAIGSAAAMLLCILRFSQESPFLYFQF
jgi:alginate O-acetyltransferase complex protein AlgI